MSTHDAGATKARDAALQGALSQIERQFGKGTVMRMGDPGAQVKVNAIPTGALSLDLALGIGGVPRGRIVEIFGPESSGKTTLVYHIIAEAQKLGGVCAFIDAEHAMDPLYAGRDRLRGRLQQGGRQAGRAAAARPSPRSPRPGRAGHLPVRDGRRVREARTAAGHDEPADGPADHQVPAARRLAALPASAPS